MLHYMKHSLGLILFLAVWELIGASGMVSQEVLPSIATIFAAIFDFLTVDPKFWKGFFATLQVVIFGLAAAVALALSLAVVSARYPLIRRTLEPTTDILRSLPPPALVPFLMFAVGIGSGLFYFVVIFGCMWPTYLSATNALSTAEPVQVNTARSFGLTDWQILWQVRVPAAMPEIFTGIRISAAISLLATVATEMMVGGGGLGDLIFNAGFSLLWDDMYALMFIIGIMGISLNLLIIAIRWPLAGWQIKYAELGAST